MPIRQAGRLFALESAAARQTTGLCERSSLGEEQDLRLYLAVLRRWLWLVVACTLLGAVSAFLVSSNMTPVYQASAFWDGGGE